MAVAFSQTVKSGYRPDIDGLRALAVVAVIINHIDKKLLPSGHLGVDIFFVISGFVITSSLVKHSSRDFGSFLTSFYDRRFRRLLPALIFYVLIAGLLICLVNVNPGLSLRTGIAALFGFSNMYLLSQQTNYFSEDANMNIFTHTWSLGVEEQFYLIFPVLVWFTGLSKQSTKRQIFRFVVILSALMTVSWIVYKTLSASNPSAAFFLMPARFWELGMGSLCFLLSRHGPPAVLNRVRYPMPILILLILSLSFRITPWLPTFRLTTVVVLLTALLLLNLQPLTFGRKLLSIKPLVTIGLMSYSLYLWHWGFICLARWSIGLHETTLPLILGFTVASSYLSYRTIENRFRHGPIKLQALKVLTIGLAASSLAAGFLYLLATQLASRFFLSVNNPLDRFEEVDGFAIYHNCNYYYGTHKFNPIQDVERCTFKTKQAYLTHGSKRAPHIFYLGNSHAAQLSGMISKIQQIGNHSQTILVTSAIMNPPLPRSLTPPPANTQSWTDEGIATQNNVATHIINTAKAGDIILLGNNLSFFAINKNDSQEKTEKTRQALLTWLSSLSNLAKRAEKQDLNIVILAPVPPLTPVKDLSVDTCVRTWFRPNIPQNCFTSRDREETRQSLALLNRSLKEMQIKHKNIFVFDPFDIICTEKICRNYHKDGRLYTDHMHLNNRGSNKLALPFMKFLDQYKLS